MRSSPSSDRDPPRLRPAGQRWGFGAHSVMPYLSGAASANTAQGEPEASIRNPVFSHMDVVARAVRRRH